MFAMDDQETLKAVGALIEEAWKNRYPSRRQFAKAVGADIKTVVSAGKGERAIAFHTQNRIEKALGWRKGSIENVWQHRTEIPVENLTLEEMERGATEDTWEDLEKASNVTRASQLTDEELLAELQYRFRNYKVRLNGES